MPSLNDVTRIAIEVYLPAWKELLEQAERDIKRFQNSPDKSFGAFKYQIALLQKQEAELMIKLGEDYLAKSTAQRTSDEATQRVPDDQGQPAGTQMFLRDRERAKALPDKDSGQGG